MLALALNLGSILLFLGALVVVGAAVASFTVDANGDHDWTAAGGVVGRAAVIGFEMTFLHRPLH